MIFRHSGNIGDIIYSLPTLREFGTDNILNLHVSRLMSEKMANDLIPLLLAQPYIRSARIGDKYDVLLDDFRNRPLELHGGHIAMWYNHTTCKFPDLSRKWIHVKKNDAYSRDIIINRTLRYRNEDTRYDLLNQINRPKLFWGSDREYAEFKYYVDCERVIFKDYLELAEALAGCYAFVGNTSFCYALAEGLKIRRVVEVPQFSPNAFPIGDKGYQFSFNDMFDGIIKQYL